ncbi:MAG: AMP-binding protein [Alphaproteobacteria bacterium]|nr:AMP-binding protein [Alphaproteobacteria bacterium]
MTTYNVASHLRRHAAERPDQPALLYPSPAYTDASPAWDRLTYREFDARSDAYARGFASAGVKQGDRVLMLMKPQMDLWVVLFALFKIGAVPVILDPGMGRKALLACIEQIGCRVMIAESILHALRTTFFRKPFAAAEVFVTVGPKIWWGGVTLKQCLEEGGEPFPLAECGEMDDAAIAFTSGSTGTPKGVGYHQGMWDTAVDAIREMLDVKAGDVSVQAFAAFAIYDLCWGHTAVIPKFDLSKPASAPPAAMVAAIQAHQAKMAFGSPIIWRRVGPYCEQNGIQLHSLDRALTTGAPTPPDMVRQFAGILREGVEFHTPYGATEAIPVSHIGSRELLEDCVAETARGAGTCVGHPAKGVEIRIIEVTDADIPAWQDDLQVEPGQIGEIVVRGGQVSVEYKESPEGNASSKIRDGDTVFHRMGDLGYLDAKGRLWFCGRKSHRLQTADGMLPCVPVEGIYNEHPDVFRTALVGVGAPGREDPVLCVEMQPGKSWGPAVQGDLEKLAAGTKYEGVVKRFLPHPGFPTDARHNSKIRRGDLKVWATAQ